MQIRPEFAAFIAERTGLAPQQIQEAAMPVDMVADSEAERGIASGFHTTTEFLRMSQNEAVEMNALPVNDPKRSGRLSLLLSEIQRTVPAPAEKADPSTLHGVFCSLQQAVEEGMGYPVSCTRFQVGADGVFSVDLLRKPVDVDDFLPDSPRMSNVKGVLFVDTTPGETGGVAYLHHQAPQYPKLGADETRASLEQVPPRADRVRPEVGRLLGQLRGATRVDREQSHISNGDFYSFTNDRNERVGSLRFEVPSLYGLSRPVPGIHPFGPDAQVYVLPDPGERYAEQIALNGDERKAALEALYQVRSQMPEPADPDRVSAESDAIAVLNGAKNLLQGMIADGNLGYYEKSVQHYGDQDNWLGRARAGQSVTLG